MLVLETFSVAVVSRALRQVSLDGERSNDTLYMCYSSVTAHYNIVSLIEIRAQRASEEELGNTARTPKKHVRLRILVLRGQRW